MNYMDLIAEIGVSFVVAFNLAVISVIGLSLVFQPTYVIYIPSVLTITFAYFIVVHRVISD